MSGPQEGTPNGVDRLAQIAERKSFYDEDGEWVYLSADERDALVEIAKAARAWAEAESSDDIMYRARRLRQVLARLDSGVDACPACGNNELCSVCLGEDSLLRPEGDRG